MTPPLWWCRRSVDPWVGRNGGGGTKTPPLIPPRAAPLAPRPLVAKASVGGGGPRPGGARWTLAREMSASWSNPRSTSRSNMAGAKRFPPASADVRPPIHRRKIACSSPCPRTHGSGSFRIWNWWPRRWGMFCMNPAVSCSMSMLVMTQELIASMLPNAPTRVGGEKAAGALTGGFFQGPPVIGCYGVFQLGSGSYRVILRASVGV